MARGLNKVMLIGNLGKDPQVTHFDGNRSKASFSLATSMRYRSKDGVDVDKTEWHRVVAWNAIANLAEKYLSKGSPVYIDGELITRSYKDPEGIERSITEIRANNMILLGSGNREASSTSGVEVPAPAVQEATESASAAVDELPF